MKTIGKIVINVLTAWIKIIGKINVYTCIDSNMIEILLSEKAICLVESVGRVRSPYF